MATTPTPHNNAQAGDIAKTVLLPGDPLRAKYIADTFLTDVTCFNTVRNMLGFTGTYQGVRVSTMGSGMGIPTLGLYVDELFGFYGVENIIRVGSAGGVADDVQVMDIVAAMGACSDSNFSKQYHLPGTYAPICSFELLEEAVAAAREQGVPMRVGNIVSNDHFYLADTEAVYKSWQGMGVLACEMESAGLYAEAARYGKKALTICTVSDKPLTGESIPAQERETGFDAMFKIALAVAVAEDGK